MSGSPFLLCMACRCFVHIGCCVSRLKLVSDFRRSERKENPTFTVGGRLSLSRSFHMHEVLRKSWSTNSDTTSYTGAAALRPDFHGQHSQRVEHAEHRRRKGNTRSSDTPNKVKFAQHTQDDSKHFFFNFSIFLGCGARWKLFECFDKRPFRSECRIFFSFSSPKIGHQLQAVTHQHPKKKYGRNSNKKKVLMKFKEVKGPAVHAALRRLQSPYCCFCYLL